MRLKISARKSDLARLQAYMVGDALKKKHPHLEIEYRFKESLGDKNLTDPLWKIPEKGVFTEDFYGELIRAETDMVVHSWKDLPTEHKSDTVIAATLPRADQRDLLLFKKKHFSKVKNSRALKVYSSSPRREYNLTNFFKTYLPFSLDTVTFESVRGNIPTRVRKLLEDENIDGLIVAKAALDRLLTTTQEEFKEVRELLRRYLEQVQFAVLPLSVNPNAAAQGALAVEIVTGRKDLQDLLQGIHDETTFQCALKERSVLASFGGGCHQKIGVAVLSRPYGHITLLKGLTDAGQVLDTKELQTSSPVPPFAEKALWSGEVKAERTPLKTSFEGVETLTSIDALYVARSEAWQDGFQETKFIWTAGLKTWKNLAEKGIWVHGSAESLGEQENAQLDVLAGKSLRWAKLSHEEGYAESTEGLPLIATYSLKPQGSLGPFTGKEFFFWSSGSQFLQAVQEAPEILKKHHACGPGNTFKVIRAYMEKNKVYDPNRLRIFLDQDDWRRQCTK